MTQNDATTPTDESHETKTYEGFLIVNWRDDNVRFRKTKPASRKTSPYEVAIEVTVNITVPDIEIPSIEADITVPPAEVEQAIIDDLPEDVEVEFEQ